MNEKLAQCFDEMLEEQSTSAEVKKKEKLSDRDLAQNVNDKLDESLSDRDKEEDVTNDDRDPGVSDDDWRELELAKIKAQNQEEIRRKIGEKEKK